MKRVLDHIRDHALSQRGIHPPLPAVNPETQWSSLFEHYMRNRMVMGGYRYGNIADKRPPPEVRCASMRKRLAAYLRDGNTEHLVDVANLCLIEFAVSAHPKAHFSAIDEHDNRVEYEP